MGRTIGTRVRQGISLGASSVESRKDSQRTTRDPGGATLQGTTVGFSNPSTITDSGNGLARFTPGAIINIVGSVSNNRQFTVVTSAAGTLTVTPGRVTTESAGAFVDIRTV